MEIDLDELVKEENILIVTAHFRRFIWGDVRELVQLKNKKSIIHFELTEN